MVTHKKKFKVNFAFLCSLKAYLRVETKLHLLLTSALEEGYRSALPRHLLTYLLNGSESFLKS